MTTKQNQADTTQCIPSATPAAGGFPPLRVLIVDDHAVVRRGVREILADEFAAVTVGEAGEAATALQLALQGQWDLVLLDIALPGRSGLDLLADLGACRPHLPVLVLSMSSEEQYALRVLRAGGAGFVSKQALSEELVAAVRQVTAGGRYVSAAIAAKLDADLGTASAPLPQETLSCRELEVLRRIASGRSVKQIATELAISGKTVFTYRERIRDKLGLHSDVELARYALEHGLVEY